MKVFVDTNIFIDILLNRKDFVKESKQVCKLCENHIVKGYVAPISINNIYYICRKAVNQEALTSFLCDVSHLFTISPMNNESVVFAKNLNIKDFEDALQSAMAIQSGCDCIVTRNIDDFKKVAGIEVFTPKEFLSKFQ